MKFIPFHFSRGASILFSLFLFGPAIASHAAGRVVEWGIYSYFDGNDLVYAPVLVPPGLTNAVSIAGGYHFSLALEADGTVVGWGDDGSLLTNLPSGLASVVAIATGNYHSLALKADGTVVAWGDNSAGQTNVPFGLTNAVAVACGNGHSLALRADGTVAAWGADFSGQTDVPAGLSNVVAIAAGGWNSLALKADGTVVEWGSGTSGEADVPGDLTNAVAIAAGAEHSLALRADGSLVTWGFNGYDLASIPPAATNVVAIAAGEHHSLALKDDGTVVAWGANHYTQTAVPTGLSNVVAIAGGAYHSVAVQNDGAPCISRQPVDRIVYSGTIAELTVGATGLPPLAYHWQFNGTNVGVTAAGLLLLTNVQPANSATYSIEVTSPHGTVNSANAILTVVNSAPIIVAGPTNQTVFGGSNATFAVTAKGSLPMTYRWRFKGADVPQATNSTLILTDIQWTNTGNYSVVVSNRFGTTTNSADLSLLALSITGQPKAQSVLGGASATFSVAAIGQGPFQYQWRLNNTNLLGATNNPLVLTNVQLNQAGDYSVVVGNSFGTLTSSNAALAVIPFRITSQPQSQTAGLGATVYFSVAVAGQVPFAYQWQFQGTNLASATNSTLTLTNVRPSQAGLYAVLVSNVFGSAMSTNATLSVSSVLVWGNNSYGQTNVPASATNVIALAAGDYHCLALRGDGTVVAWGYNGSRQTNVPPDLTNVVSIAAGSTHSLALRKDGTVALWGRSILTLITNVPLEATNVVALALGPGAQHALVLRADGTVVDWGNNGYGLTNIPPTARDIVSVAAGSYHSIALRSDGRVVAWGDNSSGQTNVPASATNIVAIAAGWNDNAALRADGTILVWGYSAPPTFFRDFTNVVDLVCPFGSSSFLAVRRNGTLVEQPTMSPAAYRTNKVAAVAAGSYNGLALVGSGPPVFPGVPVNRTVVSGATAYLRMMAVGALPLSYQWSFNDTNIIGATNSVLALLKVQPSQAGAYTLTASNSLGKVACSNLNLAVLPVIITAQPKSQAAYSGATVTFRATAAGQDPLSYQWQFNGTNIAGATNSSLILTNVQSSDVGEYWVVVTNVFDTITSSNVLLSVSPILITVQPQDQVPFRGATVTLNINAQSSQPLNYQWQFNNAELSGETNSSLTLTNVQYTRTGAYTVTLSNALATVSSAEAKLSVVAIAAWGSNSYGQTNVPPDLTNVLAVAGGRVHNLALKGDHEVAAWGYDDERTDVSTVPTNLVAIATGEDHNLALRDDGTVVGWGRNSFGQTNVPAGLTNVVAIAAGDYFSVVLKAAGTVIAWGRNNQDQTNVPPDLTNVVAISCGSSHSLALQANGKVVAWGYNGFGMTDVPVDLSNVVSVAAGDIHSLALKADGTVVQWGLTNYSPMPAAATNVVAIAAGYGHSLALNADGRVFAWGYYYNGETNVPPDLANVIHIAAGDDHSLALVGDNSPMLHAPLSNPSWSNGFSVSLPTQSGRVYALEYKDSIEDGNWRALPLAAGNGGVLILSDPTATGTQRFYRVRRW